MKLKNVFFFLILALAIPVHLMAWGNTGHRLVVKIAYRQLQPAIKDSVNKYLHLHYIEDAGTWMDDVRSDPAYSYMAHWHYINIEKGQHYDPKSTDNIIWALNKVIGELKHRQKYPKEHIALDLKILFHLVADLHQPLHVSYGADQGGNTIAVYMHGTPTNLHKVWDTDIIESTAIAYSTRWADPSKYSGQQLAAIKRIDMIQWMNDSRARLIDVYDFKDNNITQKYIEHNTLVIEEQLLKAGIRLAAVLNEIFSPQTGKK